MGFFALLARIWEAITSVTRPPNAATLFRRADLYRQEGRFEEAAELVAQGLRLQPNNGVGHLLSAYLHLAFRQIGPAKAEFQTVLGKMKADLDDVSGDVIGVYQLICH